MPFGNVVNRFVALVVLLIVVVSPTSMFAQSASETTDWPGWRGKNRDDVSTETGLMQQWPTDGPENLWTVDHGGLGYAGFAVVDDFIYTLGADDDNEYALCLNVADGSIAWKTNIDARYVNNWGDGPRNTPTIDDDKGYFLSAEGTIKCLNLNDGSEVWAKSLVNDFGGSIPQWGYSESLLVDGDRVVATPGGAEGAMVALNKETGETIWQSRMFTDAAHYSSIIVADHPDKKHYVQLVEKAVVGIDPEDGHLLWRHEWNGRIAVIPTPIYHEKTVYVTSGYGVGSMLLDLEDLDNVKQKWFDQAMKNHHGGVILVNGHFYGHSDKVGWVCQSADTGSIVWNDKKSLGKGAIGYADGRFYLVDERTGDVVLIEASTEGFKECGRFTLSPQTEKRKPQGKIWVHPVISNGRLYLRDQEMIYCYDVSS